MSKIQNESLPKDKIKFLLLEGISETAIRQLDRAGYSSVEQQAKALEGEALKDALADVETARYSLPHEDDGERLCIDG